MFSLFLGDAVAALVGIGFGKVKICGKKTLEGFIGCFGMCFWLTALLNQTSVLKALGSALIEVLCGQIIKINDNFLIPVVSGVLFEGFAVKERIEETIGWLKKLK